MLKPTALGRACEDASPLLQRLSLALDGVRAAQRINWSIEASASIRSSLLTLAGATLYDRGSSGYRKARPSSFGTTWDRVILGQESFTGVERCTPDSKCKRSSCPELTARAN